MQGGEIGAEGESPVLAQFGNELLNVVGRAVHAVEPYLLVALVSQLFAEPFGNGGCTLYPFSHQLVFGTFQLLGSSNEIARVRPKRRSMERHYCRSCRAVETTDPLAAFPVVSGVFTIMRVGAGKDECTEVFASHFFTQSV